MKQQKLNWQNMVDKVNMVDAVMPRVPLVELVGKHRVLIENHKGVTAYDTEKILVRVEYGEICVSGKNLTLAKMSKEQLVICGDLCGVTLLGKGGTGC